MLFLLYPRIRKSENHLKAIFFIKGSFYESPDVVRVRGVSEIIFLTESVRKLVSIERKKHKDAAGDSNCFLVFIANSIAATNSSKLGESKKRKNFFNFCPLSQKWVYTIGASKKYIGFKHNCFYSRRDTSG